MKKLLNDTLIKVLLTSFCFLLIWTILFWGNFIALCLGPFVMLFFVAFIFSDSQDPHSF